jgi:hypothetical protein
MRDRLCASLVLFALLMFVPPPVFAQDTARAADEDIATVAERAERPDTSAAGYVIGPAMRVDLSGDAVATPAVTALALPGFLPTLADAQAAQRPKAFEYSEAYQTRRKIHVYASFATLPLFVTQFALGTSLYDTPSDGKRTAHKTVGISIGALFGVNTVTGVWNLWEGRKDPTRRGRRMAHGFMMLAADAGFVATGLLAPSEDGSSGNRSAHRAVAITSMSIATASYLFMLFTR